MWGKQTEGNSSDLVTEMSKITSSCRRLKCVANSKHENPLRNFFKKKESKKSTRSTENAQASLRLPSEGTANEKGINMKILQNQNAN